MAKDKQKLLNDKKEFSVINITGKDLRINLN